jgi:monofunctional biosynthetic peptidoglycan transglycosylase
MSLVWPKQRIVEVYLNIAEWGPGVYGAEAAAQYHFGKSAASLNNWQASMLVAALPNPHVRIAGKPGPRTQAIASRLRGRVSRESADASCIFDN